MNSDTIQTQPTLKKTVRTAFGKKVYLLGRFNDGHTFWMKEPTWDCGWYWGVGYVNTYTRREGPPAKDTQSHQHYDSLLFRKHEYYDTAKQTWRLGSDYLHILSDHPDVAECVLTTNEQWILSDLMKTAYTLQQAAETFGRGSSHLTGDAPILIQDKDLAKRINEVELPKIFRAIAELLTPQPEAL